MSFLHRKTLPKARKEHVCTRCGAVVKPGERYARTDGLHVYEGKVEAYCEKLCAPCAFDPDDGGWLPGDLANWAKGLGAKVSSRDMSYNVGYHRVPEFYTEVEIDGERYTLEYVHSGTPDLADFLGWLLERPSLPDISEMIEAAGISVHT